MRNRETRDYYGTYGAALHVTDSADDKRHVILEIRGQTTDADGLRKLASALLLEAKKLEGVKPAKKARKSLGPQHIAILDHLRAKGSITNVEANAVHRIRSLPRRILDLKEAGYEIKADMKKDPTGQRYVRYSLAA